MLKEKALVSSEILLLSIAYCPLPLPLTKEYLYLQRDKFLGYLSDIRGYSLESIRTYELNLTEAIFYFTITKIDDSYEFDITPYRVHIKDLAKKTIAKKVSIIRSFVEYLSEKKYKIRVIGDDSIKVPHSLPKPISHRYILEALEFADEEEKLIILLIYSLGLRVSELVKVKKSDISHNWVRIEGKGGKLRELLLIDTVATVINSYIEKIQPKTFIFEKNSKNLSENYVRYKVGKLFKKIGIKATPHQLRHSFATELLNGGARINDVSEMLGHANLSTTQIYTKLNNFVKLKNYKDAHPIYSSIKRNKGKE